METADKYLSQRYLLRNDIYSCEDKIKICEDVEKSLPRFLEISALEDHLESMAALEDYLEYLEDDFITTMRNHQRYLNNKYDDKSDFLKHFTKFLKQNIKELEHTIRFHELFSANVLVELSNRCKADSSEDKFNEVRPLRSDLKFSVLPPLPAGVFFKKKVKKRKK